MKIIFLLSYIIYNNCLNSGIWMWSEPFIRTSTASGGEKLAVLLMDTQGMFDNETTMTLTAQIFGLSTLVSSFQVSVYYIYIYIYTGV